MAMHGEISKKPFGDDHEEKHFESINMQMGRVQLDSDWNEAFEILLKSRSRAYRDIIGKHGSPNDGFRIDNALIIDHLESKDGWSFKGTGTCEIEYFEKVEGNGSFRITGEVTLERQFPELLKQLTSLQAVLVERGATAGAPKLLLHYKVSATEKATIRLSIEEGGETEPFSIDAECNGWQVLELDISNKNLSAFTIEVETNGTVFLDRLALDPGLLKDDLKNFYIQGGDGTSDGAGRYYVDGLACVKEGFETYLTQKDYPEPVEIPNSSSKKLVYLDAWKRTVTAIEDPDILEDALGGPDTCTREQLISQVKVIDAPGCKADIAALKREQKSGTLTAKLAPQSKQAECDFKPELDYTGLNNSLYRIEIHEGGNYSSATFKWSRNNGADLVPVKEFDPDNKSVIVPDDRLLCCGDWVELCDDVSDLSDFSDTGKHGILAKIIAPIEHQSDGVKITLDILSTEPFKSRTERHPKLRKWHGVEDITDYMEVDANGVPKKELEHGIRPAFSNERYYHGDYWQFTARVNTCSIEELDKALPMGPQHHYAPLSVISNAGGEMSFESCRNIFPPLTDLKASDIKFDSGVCNSMTDLDVDNVQQAIESLCKHHGCCDEIVVPGQSIQKAIERIAPEGGSVCLARGIHIVTKTILIENYKNLIIRGDGNATRVIYLPEEPGIDDEEVERLKGEIDAINEEINSAKEAGNNEEVERLKGERRGLLEDYYAIQGMSETEIGIKIKIYELEEQLKEIEDDADKKKELKTQIYELERDLAAAESVHLHDLFRVRSSEDIVFENFLMLSFGSDSLVAISRECMNIALYGCTIINLLHPKPIGFHGKPYKKFSEDIRMSRRDIYDRWVPDINMRKKRLQACIRVTDCCEITIENNRLMGNVGLLQQGEADARSTPIINGLKCLNNLFKIGITGIVLIEGRRVIIKDNDIFPYDMGWKEEDYNKFKELMEIVIPSDGQCIAKTNKEADNLVDGVIELISGCIPEIKSMTKSKEFMIKAFILRMSRIERNRIAGMSGLDIFYSEKNEIARNRIMCRGVALSLIYNFNTRVYGNTFETVKPAKGDFRNDRTEEAGSLDIPSAPGGLGIESSIGNEGAMFGEIRVQKNYLGFKSPSVIEVHFSDRLIFDDNEIKGINGFIVHEMSIKDFAGTLSEFAWLWNTPFNKEAVVLLAKRFSDLMGLRPTIHLLETMLKIFSGGKEVDWVELLLQAWTETPGHRYSEIASKSPGISVSPFRNYGKLIENPFVKILIRLFESLLQMQLVSRSVISENRFEVESVGIKMEDGITLGGTRLMKNRFVGANNTAILWKSRTVLSNPELNGLLLGCAYNIILSVLVIIRKFLKQLVKFFEEAVIGGEEVSPILVFFSMLTLYGIGQTCPGDEEETEDGTTPSEPENSFIGIINDIIRALDDLIDQLSDESVKKNISDLSISDDRISINQIRGKGNGININIANSIIESNRIDVEPGKSAIAELFSIGRYISTHAKVLNDTDGSGVFVGHTAVESLGLALMNMDPNALEASNEMLSEHADQWVGLDTVLDEIIKIINGSANTNRIHKKAVALKDIISSADPSPDGNVVRPASEELIEAFNDHLSGYGMILESPGMQVINNRVEAVQACNLTGISGFGMMTKKDEDRDASDIASENRQAPGGILMTGSNDNMTRVIYSLLFEEAFPLFNIGGQGTLFSGNSLQWGTGHGLSLSSLPVMADVKIENNEIQNHGLAGILCDKTTLLPTFLPLYKLRITENEINQCFRNKASGISLDPPPYLPTILGGVTIRNAKEINCSRNNIRACGKGDDAWPSFGTLFVDCNNVRFEGNKILENGHKNLTDPDEEVYFPRGGVVFLNGSGNLNLLNNNLAKNDGITLMLIKNYTMGEIYYSINPYYFFGFSESTVGTVGTVSAVNWDLDRLLVTSNVFEVEDQNLSPFAKIILSNIDELSFSQNQVSLLNVKIDNWKGISLAANRLIFNGNMVTGNSQLPGVALNAASKGVVIGNLSELSLNTTANFIIDHNG